MKYIKYATLLIAALLTFSCVQNPSGLFYSLQYETGISDGPLDNKLTVGGMTSRGGNYFIASGNFMYRAVNAASATEWTASTPVTGDSCYKLIDLDEIYAIFFNTETLDYKLYKADTSAIATGITWSAINIAAIPTDESIVDIAESGSRIFLYTEKTVAGVAGNDKRYSVYSTAASSLADGTVLVPEPNISSISSYGEFDIDFDGTNYWLISGNKLFSGSSRAMTENTAAAAVTDRIKGAVFGGVICIGTDIYLSTEEGVLLKYTTAAGWTDLTPATAYESLFDFKRVTIAADSIDVLLLGSAQGYYELDLNAAAPAFNSPKTAETNLTTKVQFASIEMSNDILRDFYVDSSTGRVFALGYSAGLWKNSLSDDGARFWDIE